MDVNGHETIAKLTRSEHTYKLAIRLKGMSFTAMREWPDDEVARLFPNGETVAHWECRLVDAKPGIVFLKQVFDENW